MKANHTPGPWHLSNLAANGEQEISISRSYESGGASVAVVESSRDHSRLLADARLIAAAPDLLEALEELLADRYLADPINADRMKKARAAIAKATGTAL
jgi:hypothetical protein